MHICVTRSQWVKPGGIKAFNASTDIRTVSLKSVSWVEESISAFILFVLLNIWDIFFKFFCGEQWPPILNVWLPQEYVVMVTWSNKNIFQVTGPLCGNSPVTVEFLSQRPVMRSFDVFFDLQLNKGWSKQSWLQRSETPLCSLWCHCNLALQG